MNKWFLLVFVLVFSFACSKNEAPTNTNFDPLATQNKEDPLKLGTGACKVDQKKDCDTDKK